tara:strand:+ start:2218 stop:2457 length:240 start_codon:yes stop_codon:yes gene_type:complete
MKQKNFLEADIAKIFKIELGIKVKKNNKIYDHDKWDSLGNFNVLLACEKKFNIKFSNSEFNKLNSFEEIFRIVKKKIKK